jgi:hypothetical protein
LSRPDGPTFMSEGVAGGTIKGPEQDMRQRGGRGPSSDRANSPQFYRDRVCATRAPLDIHVSFGVSDDNIAESQRLSR